MINWRFYVIYFFSMQLCWMCSSVGRASDSRPESRQFKSGHVQEHMWDDVLLQHKVVVRDSIVASIPACHAGDRGLIPPSRRLSNFWYYISHVLCVPIPQWHPYTEKPGYSWQTYAFMPWLNLHHSPLKCYFEQSFLNFGARPPSKMSEGGANRIPCESWVGNSMGWLGIVWGYTHLIIISAFPQRVMFCWAQDWLVIDSALCAGRMYSPQGNLCHYETCVLM